jgi:hypothetical protein
MLYIGVRTGQELLGEYWQYLQPIECCGCRSLLHPDGAPLPPSDEYY